MKKTVVVLGNNFGGLTAALSLKRELKDDVNVKVGRTKRQYNSVYNNVFDLLLYIRSLTYNAKSKINLKNL